MTGLEPHPILALPSKAEAEAMGPGAFEEMRLLRLSLLQKELSDPYRNGWRSPIWDLADDLLVEGNQVELVGREYLEIPKEIRETKSPSLKIVGRRELLIHGTNGAAKSEYAAFKIMRILVGQSRALTWCFQRTEEVSQSVQQPLLMKYIPKEWKPGATGKMKDGGTANITWSDKGAFTKNSFVLPNGSHNWFKFYKQDEDIVEGPQIHAIWCDEMLYEIGLLKTLRYRLMKHQGILIITFTPKSGWTPTVAEYNQGRKVVVSLTAKRLPIRDDSGKVTGRYKQMPRVAIAGPGTEGGLKANIVWFNITDNPFVPETEIDRNLKGATEKVIMERGYGEATKAFGSKFPKFTEAVHCFDPKCLPRQGTRYQIVDPVDGRNWFVLWMLVDPLPITLRDGSTMHRRWIYREFPSTNGTHPSAYVTGVGDPGAWALPGDAADGQRGPAQESWGWGWERYKFEFERLEGKKGENVQRSTSNVQRPTEEMIPAVWRNRVRNPLKGSSRAFDAATVVSDDGREEIFERRMDSRYGNTPRGDKARTTTLIEQMAEIGLWYEPASGKDIGEGVQLINNLLDYDEEVEIGRYSPALRRINQPLLYVSTECPNLIYSLREWTGKDGAHGACKDPIDVLRYAVEDDLDFVGAETYAWAGGGTY